MDEYIERETMIQAIREYSGFFQDSPSTNHMILKMEAEDVARDLEAADVAPVVHGRWVLRHEGRGHYWECSVCHENPCIYVTKNTKFCSNCGAKMDLTEG